MKEIKKIIDKLHKLIEKQDKTINDQAKEIKRLRGVLRTYLNK